MCSSIGIVMQIGIDAVSVYGGLKCEGCLLNYVHLFAPVVAIYAFFGGCFPMGIWVDLWL